MAGSDAILNRYATALHALARQAGIQEQIEAQLLDFDHALAGNESLRKTLENPRRTRAEKRRVLAAVLGDATTPLLRNTVLLMADKGRAALLPGFARVYGDVAMAAAGRQVAKVTSAAPLDDDTRRRLKEQLERLTGKTITLEERLDESLLGGLRVVVGSQMIDGSLRRRLQNLENTLLRVPLAGAQS